MTQPSTPKLVHAVYFQLNEPTDDAIAALIAAANHYLTGHEGCLSFAVGGRAEQYQREVNDATFHVALNVVFESEAAHDAYQVAPRHLEFIETQAPTWAQVRVFDSLG